MTASHTHAHADATARWLAGLSEDEAQPVSAAQQRTNDAWRELAVLRTGPMQVFAARHFQAERSGCRTLFYPFSGPDVLNALTLFPTCDRYVLFGLEPVGELPRLQGMSAAMRAAVLADMARAQDWNIRRNFFVTNFMRRDLNAPNVRGVLPLMLTMLVRTGHRIVSVELANADGSAFDARQRSRPRGVNIVFERLGGARQTLFYASFDASDRGLRARPDFLNAPVVREMGAADSGGVVTLLKAASYLLHDPAFSTMRELVAERSALIVQDDSGMPYKRLLDAGFEVALLGQYRGTIPVFGYRFQPDLAAAYRAQAAAGTDAVLLPFDWSYMADRAQQSLQIARRSAGAARRGA